MRFHQMRITSYFKSAINNSTSRSFTSANSVIKLASNRKHADLKFSVKSIWIDHLTSRNSYDSHSIKSHHICRGCTQHFISRNMLHRHLRHCSRCTQRWLFVNSLINAENLIEKRHFFCCINNVSFSLLTHAE